MIKAIRDDLADASDAVEHLLKKLDTLTRQEQIDVAARVKAIAKNAEKIDKAVKDNIKGWRKNKEGYVLGEFFKAYMQSIPTTRFDQASFEVEEPTLYAKYLKTSPVLRITYEVR